MTLDPKTIAKAAERIGIKTEELSAILQRGDPVTYAAGEYLFHESAPRQWLGVILSGEVELTRGQHGRAVTVGRAGVGAVLSEGVMLDDTAHSTSGFSRAGATIWQI